MAGRPRTYDREEVLERAMNLFWAKGFEGTHLSELVDVTELNRFSLYKEFGGKRGLFQEALGRYLEGAEARYDHVLGADPPGLDNIFAYFDQLHFAPGYHGCFMINTLAEKHVVSSAAFEMACRTVRRTEGLFRRNLEAAQAAGEVSAELGGKGLAKLLTALDQGLSTYGIVSSSNRSKAAIVRQVRALLGRPVEKTS